MGVPRMKVGSVRHTQMRTCVLADTLVQQTFFVQLLCTSAVAMVTQGLRCSQIAGLAVEEQGRGRQGDFVGGVPRGTGRGPDTKIMRSMRKNSYVCHLIFMGSDSEGRR